MRKNHAEIMKNDIRDRMEEKNKKGGDACWQFPRSNGRSERTKNTPRRTTHKYFETIISCHSSWTKYLISFQSPSISHQNNTHTLTVFGFPSSPTAPISAPMVRGSVSEVAYMRYDTLIWSPNAIGLVLATPVRVCGRG
jgi:hypothetical protein